MCCYDAITGKLLWKEKYDGIDQDEFSNVEESGGVAVANYQFKHVAIDLATGKQLWRQSIPYYGKLQMEGTYNYTTCGKLGKWVFFLEDDHIGIFNIKDGKQVFQA